MNYQEYFESVKGKTAGVFGMGISNRPLIDLLLKAGALVVAGDKKTHEELGDVAKDLEQRGVKLVLGDDFPDKMEGDILFRTPGMRPDIPAISSLVEKGSVLTSEMEVFFEVCPAPIIAVTGSDGKTTTTTLISEMLKKEGYTVHIGGNIGKPLLPEIANIMPEHKVVVELSSFQLMTMKKSPHIAVMTNISPNHLDVHKGYEEYIEAKKNIMLYQSDEDILISNLESEETKKAGELAKGEWRAFSSKNPATVCLKDGFICYKGEKILSVSDIKIPGKHNVENYMAAIGAVKDMVSNESIVHVAKNFGGVPHRIEFVRELCGVKYYNSSIDSSPNRTKNTLSVFPEKVVMISGGKDKGIPYDEIGPVIVEHVKVLVLIGATSDAIENAVKKAYSDLKIEPCVKILRAEAYEQAVSLAKENSVSGDCVVLSPASTSFDMFKNFEERGECFKKYVMEL